MTNKYEFNYTFFSKETIDQQFELLHKRLKPSMDYKILIKEFHEILVNRVLPTVVYDSSSGEFTVYRITDTWENFNPDDPNCYSYNPNPPKNGRAHRAGYPVFYGSIDPFTAFSEMKNSLTIDKIFYMSRWKIKFQSNTTVHSLIINSSTTESEHILNSVIKKIHDGLKGMVKNLPEEIKDGYVYAVEKMGDLFTTPGDSNYHITSAYSHEILYDGKRKGLNVPILMFPSVENNLKSVNWAIHPTFVDSEYMRLQDVFELSLIESNSKNQKADVRVSIHRKGSLIENGNIKWQIPHFSAFKINFDKIIIRTYSNQIIDGCKTSELKVNDGNFTIKDLIETNIHRNVVQAKLSEFNSNSESDDPLDFKKETFNSSLVLEFDHGSQIETKTGKSCVKYIQVPISWTREFKY